MLITAFLALFAPLKSPASAVKSNPVRSIFVGTALLCVLGAGWWLASPLLINVHVDEALPTNLTADLQPVASGSFIDLSFIHRGEGSALIFESETGQVLRFEDFKVTNGPDLQVLLVADIGGVDKNTVGDYIDLGPLKGNVGNQNYQIPADIDLSKYSGVVIYCEPFNVVFSIAAFGS